MPCNASGRPMPESSSRCGEPIAPAVSTISRARVAVDLAGRRRIFEAGDAAVLDDQLSRQRARDELQVGPPQDGLQERLGGGDAQAAPLVDLEIVASPRCRRG